MLKEIMQESRSPIDFFAGYMKYLSTMISKINVYSIESIFNAIQGMQKRDGTLYIIANGGSSAIASHIVNDIGFGIRNNKGPFYRIVNLTDNMAVITALSNDISYENIFVEQLKVYLEKKDLLMAISVSGNSSNILKAVEYAKNMDVTVIGCTGFDGGKLKLMSNINFHVPTEKGEYGPVEDIFQILDHAIYSYLRFNKQRKI